MPRGHLSDSVTSKLVYVVQLKTNLLDVRRQRVTLRQNKRKVHTLQFAGQGIGIPDELLFQLRNPS
jgi:hypothetical protein